MLRIRIVIDYEKRLQSFYPTFSTKHQLVVVTNSSSLAPLLHLHILLPRQHVFASCWKASYLVWLLMQIFVGISFSALLNVELLHAKKSMPNSSAITRSLVSSPTNAVSRLSLTRRQKKRPLPAQPRMKPSLIGRDSQRFKALLVHCIEHSTKHSSIDTSHLFSIHITISPTKSPQASLTCSIPPTSFHNRRWKRPILGLTEQAEMDIQLCDAMYSRRRILWRER